MFSIALFLIFPTSNHQPGASAPIGDPMNEKKYHVIYRCRSNSFARTQYDFGRGVNQRSRIVSAADASQAILKARRFDDYIELVSVYQSA
jgi:hypothetical protein